MLTEMTQSELTPQERITLTQCEAVIEQGLQTFVDVGNALLTIRDQRLYREHYATFEQYCRERWGMGRHYANRMIAAAQTTQLLVPTGTKTPTCERHVRPLTELEPDEQIEAWQRAVETAPGGKITGAHVRHVVEEFKAAKRPHVAYNSGNNEWYTPAEYIEAARAVMRGIDLDPASSELANRTVRATRFYTREDDGLAQHWKGRVWMNPPYSSDLIGRFADKLASHIKAGDVSQACVLVNNATETGWFNTLLDVASCVCFVRGRVKFIDSEGNPTGAPLQGQVVLYMGPNASEFGRVFSVFGMVFYARRDSV